MVDEFSYDDSMAHVDFAGDDVRPRVLGDAEEATKDLLFSLIASGALRPMAACRVAEWAASLRRRLDTKLDVWWEDGDA